MIAVQFVPIAFCTFIVFVYTLYRSEVSAFFKVTLPLALIPTMVVRQYYSYKLE
jgi:hypothetical protein